MAKEHAVANNINEAVTADATSTPEVVAPETLIQLNEEHLKFLRAGIVTDKSHLFVTLLEDKVYLTATDTVAACVLIFPFTSPLRAKGATNSLNQCSLTSSQALTFAFHQTI